MSFSLAELGLTVQKLEQQVHALSKEVYQLRNEQRQNVSQNITQSLYDYQLFLSTIPQCYHSSPLLPQIFEHLQWEKNQTSFVIQTAGDLNQRKEQNEAKEETDDELESLEIETNQSMMEFFYNGAIQRNRLKMEEKEREIQRISQLPTIAEQQRFEQQNLENLYGKQSHQILQHSQLLMDTEFVSMMEKIHLENKSKQKKKKCHNFRNKYSQKEQQSSVMFWPATPLAYS